MGIAVAHRLVAQLSWHFEHRMIEIIKQMFFSCWYKRFQDMHSNSHIMKSWLCWNVPKSGTLDFSICENGHKKKLPVKVSRSTCKRFWMSTAWSALSVAGMSSVTYLTVICSAYHSPKNCWCKQWTKSPTVQDGQGQKCFLWKIVFTSLFPVLRTDQQ